MFYRSKLCISFVCTALIIALAIVIIIPTDNHNDNTPSLKRLSTKSKIRHDGSDVTQSVQFNADISLYKPSDQVTVLSYKTFYDTLSGKPHIWILQFYSSSCGHCLHFSALFKEYAKHFIDWEHTARLAVMNCATEENIDICAEYIGQGFPAVFVLPANSTARESLGEHVIVWTPEDITYHLVNHLTELQEKNKGSKEWTRVLPFKGTKKDLFALAPKNVNKAVVFVDKLSSRKGKQALLYFGYLKKEIIARWVINGTGLATNFTSKRFPAAILYDRDEKAEPRELRLSPPKVKTFHLVKNVLDKHKIDKDILPSFRMRLHEKNLISDRSSNNRSFTEWEEMSSREDKVYLVDIENALRYALVMEIGAEKVLDGEKLEALRDFLSVLVKYLPARPAVHDFLENFYMRINKAEASLGSLTRKQYLQTLKVASHTGFFPRKQEYVGCKGSRPYYRGYNCALWTMFHVLTVSAYEIEKDSEVADPMETMQAIHDYVKYFFKCRSCSEHFQKMYHEPHFSAANYVVIHRDGVMWLWKAHNRVNGRLAGDESEDPMYPKVRFPNPKHCKRCRMRFRRTRRWRWVLYSVRVYLVKLYSKYSLSLYGVDIPDSVTEPTVHKTKESRIEETDKKTENKPKYSVFAKVIDLNTCILYGTTSLVISLIYLCYRINKRIKQGPIDEPTFKNT